MVNRMRIKTLILLACLVTVFCAPLSYAEEVSQESAEESILSFLPPAAPEESILFDDRSEAIEFYDI
jgi:hypothetical protein